MGCADKGVYVGEKKDGKRHGQGKFKWSDGDKYVGEFKDGKRNGQGTYTWSGGSMFVGEWKDDKKDGQGTYTQEKISRQPIITRMLNFSWKVSDCEELVGFT